MKTKRMIGLGLIVAVVAGTWLLSRAHQSVDVDYQFTTITIADIEMTVSATGTVTPVTTIEVGTQISGTIDTVLVDYNDPVAEGQVLAILDTALLQASVIDAEAAVERTEALLEEAESDCRRNQALYEKQLISESAFFPYQIAVKTRKADLKSAEASLARAQRNLEYAVIRAPIDGIVIQRNVEEGQTVAASLSTPTLFIIAQDLSQMEILAEVDESDIGTIEVGQPVRFEVATYPDLSFDGLVSQIRLQPAMVSNVVTYTVVATADNPEDLLLPGMTATVDFVIDQRNDVLTVPTRALSFSPSNDVLEELRDRRLEERTADTGEPGDQSNRPIMGDPSQRPDGLVWYVDSLGNVAPAPLITGLSDGSSTEVVSSRVLTEGMAVIVSGTASGDDNSSSVSQPMGPPPGGPGSGMGRRGF